MAIQPKSTVWNRQPTSQVQPVGTLAKGLAFCGLPIDSNRLIDVSGNNFHGGIGGSAALRVIDGPGVGNKFATNQYYNLGTDARLCPTAEITVLSWFRVTGSGNYVYVARDDNSLGRGFTLDNSGSQFRFYVNGGGTPDTNSLISDFSFAVNDLRLLIGTFCDASNTASLWENGRIARRSTSFTGTIAASTAATRVAARTYSGFEGFATANIFLTCIWNRALSDAECRVLAANPWALFGRTQQIVLSNFPAAAAGAFHSRYYYDMAA